jgi:hypothetical protein
MQEECHCVCVQDEYHGVQEESHSVQGEYDVQGEYHGVQGEYHELKEECCAGILPWCAARVCRKDYHGV